MLVDGIPIYREDHLCHDELVSAGAAMEERRVEDVVGGLRGEETTATGADAAAAAGPGGRVCSLVELTVEGAT